MARFLAICLSSTIQRTVVFENLALENVNRSKKYRMDASGKAVNSARILNELENGCVDVVCPLGEKNADLFLDLAKNDDLHILDVRTPGFTRECWTLLDFAQKTTTELVVGEPALDKKCVAAEEKLLDLVKNALLDVDAVLLAGSRPEIWNDDLTAKISKMATDEGKLFLADFWGKDLLDTLKICTPNVIKINEEEFCKTFDVCEDDLKTEITKKSAELQNMIVVTRGTDDTFAAKNGNFYSVPIEKVVPVNTTACGDSFNAGFLYEYANSGDFVAALEKGTWCAARNAERECPGSTQDSVFLLP